MSTHTMESPLDLLRGELKKTSRQAQLALESYFQKPGDKAVLTSAADLFRQIRGALVMLEQEDIAAVAEEIIISINALDGDEAAASGTPQDVLLRAVLQMPQYLEWLHHGRGQHLDVSPLLRQLRAARGDAASSTGVVPPVECYNLSELAGELRPTLQRALVGMLRGHNLADNLSRIEGIFAKFKETAPDEPAYRFWWLAESLVDELRDGGIAPSPEINFLLRDLDNQVKLLKETGVVSYDGAAQKNLGHRIIEQLSGSAGGAKRIDERIDYHPPNGFSESMPADIEVLAPPDIETLLQIAAHLKEDLALVRDAVDRFERSGSLDAAALRGELEKLHQVANVLLFLNMEVPAEILGRRLTSLEGQATGGENVTGEQLFTLATELVLIEDSLDAVGDFAIRKELSTPDAESMDSGDRMGLLRGVQFQQARSLATHSAIGLMKEARERISAHLESGGDPGVWCDLQSLLRKVGGALVLLESDRAAALVRHLEGVVQCLAEGRATQEDEVVGVFSEVLVAVEYYLYLMVGSQRPDEGILDHADTQLRLLDGRTPAPPKAAVEPELPVAAEEESTAEPNEPAVGVPAEPAPAAVDQELVDLFTVEAAEILDSSDTILQNWSADQEDRDLLDELRHEMHTLKGSARMAGFMAIGDVAHATESLLDAMAVGNTRLSAVILDALQRAQDALGVMVTQARRGGEALASEDLFNVLNDLARIDAQPPAPPKTAAPRTAIAKPAESVAPIAQETIRVSAALLNSLVNQMGESSIYRARIDQQVGVLGFNLSELDQTVARLRKVLRRLEIETETQILFRYEEGVKDHREDFDPLELDRFSDLQQLSRALMETVDDLVNIKHTLEDQSQEIGFLLDQQAKINKEIQQGLMRTGMVKFNTMMPRLRRVVRQACQELNKSAELVLEGSESEVDRGILENMIAPLEHLMRNAVTHGIETPEQRRKIGKPSSGVVAIALSREGGELVLTVRDDGAGLDFDAIQARGRSLGFLESGQPATEQELIALLLRPGFSTADRVTQLAGRGVGMDVVNDAVKAMRGALNIRSLRGGGVEFTLRLPFSLAVTQALLVQAGSEVYAVPLLSVEAVTRLDGRQLNAYLTGEAIDLEYGRHRYPLHSLGVVFAGEMPQGAAIEACAPALLFRSAEYAAALQVDTVLGSQEIIVKPVVPQLHAVPGISGATVLGDGRVVLVLELAALVRSLAARKEKPAEMIKLRTTQQKAGEEQLSVLVVDDSITVRKVTARFLERHEFQVTTAKDGLDAIALLEQKAPDLIIMDIEMPRMDGFEVLAAIQNQPLWRHLPVIMVTSRGGEKHRERAKNLGVSDYMVKPYQEDELIASIRKILDCRSLGIPA